MRRSQRDSWLTPVWRHQPAERATFVLRRKVSPFSYVKHFLQFPLEFFAAQAGVTQAENEFPAYGQGMQGYGKRFGAALADGTSNGLFRIYVYPTLLKEDPRYFRLGEGSFGHRLVYGLEQSFVCHTDKGGRSFNFSNILERLLPAQSQICTIQGIL